MKHFITTDSSSHLSIEQGRKSVPIHALSPSVFSDWVSSLSAAHSKWVTSNNFTAQKNEIIMLPGQDGNLETVVIGLGDEPDPSSLWAYSDIAKKLPDGFYHLTDETTERLSAIGWELAQYGFDTYQDRKNDRKAILVLKDKKNYEMAKAICAGIGLVRDLVNTPTCDMGPSHLSAVLEHLAHEYDAEFKETVGDDLLEAGYRTIHAVGRAATNQPRLLEMTWGRQDAPKITLVGKGVCFDTGGLDIKTSSGMRLMKKDMGGAAHVMGLAHMIMATKLDIRLRLLIPAVENNISGNAFRPGDIIKTYLGTTVEIDNTDAEGRLILCDALTLASEENPDLIIDFATLTGAARVALGTDVVPFFTDDNNLANDLMEHSVTENDPVWRLPLYAPYEPLLKSNSADLNNMGAEPFGGAIMAALFLKHFVKAPDKWVHFDVFAWNKSNRPGRPQGGEAMALRAVYTYLTKHFSE